MRQTDKDLPVHIVFSSVAERLGVSGFAVAQAWLRSLSSSIVPLPGVTRLESIQDAIGAVGLQLSSADIAALAELPESLPLHEELVRDQPKPE